MNATHVVLDWANTSGLALAYPTLRSMLFEGIPAGYVASLPVFPSPADQLWSDVQNVARQGPLVGGTVPLRQWLANVLAWATRGSLDAAPIQRLLVQVGGAEPVADAAPAARAAVEVLFLSANPDRERLLNIDRELNEIRTLVEATRERDRFNLSAWPDIELTQLAPRLIREKPHVLHFSGHGGRDGELLFFKDGETHEVEPEPLARLIRVTGASLRLIVLNACYSDALARHLVAAMPVVVAGMGRMVKDATALTYSQTLYQGLFDGLSIRDAHEVASATLAGIGCTDADAPVLRVPDGSDLADRPIWG